VPVAVCFGTSRVQAVLLADAKHETIGTLTQYVHAKFRVLFHCHVRSIARFLLTRFGILLPTSLVMPPLCLPQSCLIVPLPHLHDPWCTRPHLHRRPAVPLPSRDISLAPRLLSQGGLPWYCLAAWAISRWSLASRRRRLSGVTSGGGWPSSSTPWRAPSSAAGMRGQAAWCCGAGLQQGEGRAEGRNNAADHAARCVPRVAQRGWRRGRAPQDCPPRLHRRLWPFSGQIFL